MPKTVVPATAEDLFAIAEGVPAVQALHQRLEQGGLLSAAGLSEAARPFLATLLHRHAPRRPIVLVVDTLKTQEGVHQDLQTWREVALATTAGSPGDAPARGFPEPLFYPAWDVFPHEARLPHADVVSERLETLLALLGPSGSPVEPAMLVATSAVALLQRTFHPALLRRLARSLERGSRADPLELMEWLASQAYEPEAQVTRKGDIALRGGILDVYPLSSPWPVRLEFFGDELESLRYFDPHSQRSREEIAAISLPPAGELGLLRQPGFNPATDSATLLEYLPASSLLVLSEPDALVTQAADYAAQLTGEDPLFLEWNELLEIAQRRGMTVLSLAETETAGAPAAGPSRGAPGAEGTTLRLSMPSLEAYRPLLDKAVDPQLGDAQRREFYAQLHRWIRSGYRVEVFCNNEGERQRFLEIWQEYGYGQPPSPAAAAPDTGSAGPAGTPEPPTAPIPSPAPDTLSTRLGTITRGFLFDDARLVLVTDAEIFGRYRVQRPRRLKSPHAIAARSALEIDFTELEEGDYVVHVQHGIGRFQGLTLLPVSTGRAGRAMSGSAPAEAGGQECLVIEYAPTEPDQPPPRLYVPVTEAHLVSKYVGAGKARPPLNTLGGTRWAKAKAQAERAIQDLAGELLSIQAARESQVGTAFPPDTAWEREFESAFVYEETPDQRQAIAETKRDLEHPKPMDRLICGDVGFGKTEVAIRAAFKVVLGGKQVAILVPTTVLAQQHYRTFGERMADYPVRVELLSRFRTRRQQERVLHELQNGAVDIVIGTHRLVQPDVAFKELGLVVIDEEQRFGVLQKEQFKRLRRMVDVLTLSATPIPRTLYLALTGARDMSTIETPPQDRLPVETIVAAYDERVIRDAILRELNRGGQVFFLHNRVVTIDTVARRLRQLVPRARLVIGHGQMPSGELEEIMGRFINGEADVLLSTSIIESGLDIPNANTIIIDRADRFGLSDLYQLRGRVGRYKHQAYAYFLLPRHAGLLADARKRMSAIKQYSTLGSGFKIAMRDLEIRGAGNLLGPEQSGHITAVGFELYCQLLKQSVSALKGEKVRRRIDVQLRLDFITLAPDTPQAPALPPSAEPWPAETTPPAAPAYIPVSHIADARQRIEIYRKLAQAGDPGELARLRDEIRDRFGPPPAALERLVQITELKILASDRGITALETRDDRLMLTRNDDYLTVGGLFPRLTRKNANARLREIRKLLQAL